MKTKSFEQFLESKCDTHTNNSPEGFERWLENLDTQEVMDYAQEWGDTNIYPDDETKYYFIEETFGKFELHDSDWVGDSIDKKRFNSNNFFLNEKDANTALGKILNIFD